MVEGDEKQGIRFMRGKADSFDEVDHKGPRLEF